jgi:uncharacterized protein (TIGR00156 family)
MWIIRPFVSPVFLLFLLAPFFEGAVYRAFLGQGQEAFAQTIPIRTVYQRKDDDVVTIVGRVSRQLSEDRFLVRDDSGEIVVDVERERQFGVTVGQTIKVQGKVDIALFHPKKIFASSVEIMDNPTTTSGVPFAQADVVAIRNVCLSSKDREIVTVAGRIVRRIDSDEFILRDDSGEIKVDADYGRFGEMPLTAGQKIIVTGEVDVHWTDAGKDIEAQNIQVQQVLPPTPPVQVTVIPIAEVLSDSEDGDLVTISGMILQKVGVDNYIFQDETGTMSVNANHERFAHHGLRSGYPYTVTGYLKRNAEGEAEIEALLITEMPRPKEASPTLDETEPEIPISSVYYSGAPGEIVTVAGSIVRQLPPQDLLVQDETASIVVELSAKKFEGLDLSVGQFVIITGTVKSMGDAGNQIEASRVLIRKRSSDGSSQ